MPTSRTAATGTALPILLTSILIGFLPETASAQAGSALFAVGEGSNRQQRVPRQPAPEVPPVAAVNGAAPAAVAQAVGSPGSSSAVGDSQPATKPGTRPESRRRNATSKQAAVLPLDGRWHDSQCIPLSGSARNAPLYVQREFEFNDARRTWQLQASVYNSSACLATGRMLTYRGAGSFAVSGKARAASTAYDATFKVDRWSATPVTREGVLALLNDRCGSGDFEQGVALDLSRTGCPSLGIRPIAQSPQETEPVAVTDGRFFLGTRSFAPGLAFDRPAQLSSIGLVRIP